MNYETAAKIIEQLINTSEFLPIATLAKEIKEPWTTTYKTVKILEKEGVIILKRAGKSHIVILRKNPKVVGILAAGRALNTTSKEVLFLELDKMYSKIPEKIII